MASAYNCIGLCIISLYIAQYLPLHAPARLRVCRTSLSGPSPHEMVSFLAILDVRLYMRMGHQAGLPSPSFPAFWKGILVAFAIIVSCQYSVAIAGEVHKISMHIGFTSRCSVPQLSNT